MYILLKLKNVPVFSVQTQVLTLSTTSNKYVYKKWVISSNSIYFPHTKENVTQFTFIENTRMFYNTPFYLFINDFIPNTFGWNYWGLLFSRFVDFVAGERYAAYALRATRNFRSWFRNYFNQRLWFFVCFFVSDIWNLIVLLVIVIM